MADLDIPTARQLIDGDWTAAADGGELPVLDPATRETIQSVARARAVDVDHAVAAARRAAPAGRRPRPASAARSCTAGPT